MKKLAQRLHINLSCFRCRPVRCVETGNASFGLETDTIVIDEGLAVRKTASTNGVSLVNWLNSRPNG